MLDKASFLAFKNELISSLTPYSQLSNIEKILIELKATSFEADNPKGSYQKLHLVLNQPFEMTTSQSIGVLAKLFSVVTPSIETVAAQALKKARQHAEAYHATAVIHQDCMQHNFPLNLAAIVNFENINTGSVTKVFTRPRI